MSGGVNPVAYQVMYRKYRPQDFNSVKGQDAIVTTLRNQVKNGRISHAYLFTGTRGTGKTTIAKIMAKAVNCLFPVDGNPCCECSVCKSISTGTTFSVQEIDAASNNGVDSIRTMIEELRYPPTDCKYKVMIVDEVHMLSTGAFNALLKSLEEPQPYVIFILATTDVHKVIPTVASRCQRYDFQRIPLDSIVERLAVVAEAEGAVIDPASLRFIASASDGSLRDAISLLDRCIAAIPSLDYASVRSVLGVPPTETYFSLLKCICDGSVEPILLLLQETLSAGNSIESIVSGFIKFSRDLLLLSSSRSVWEMTDFGETEQGMVESALSMVDSKFLIRVIRVLSELQEKFRSNTQKTSIAEIYFIKLCEVQFDSESDPDSLLIRIRELEKQVEALQQSITEFSALECSVEFESRAGYLDVLTAIERMKEIVLPSPLDSVLGRASVFVNKDCVLLVCCHSREDYRFLCNQTNRSLLQRGIQSFLLKRIPIEIVLV